MVVDFTFTTSGTKVRFQNLSEDTPEVVSYLWNFGDGNTSSEKNPIHKYRCAGNYEVVLTVKDPISGATLGTSKDDLVATDFVKTHLSGSIYKLINTYIPRDIFGYVPASEKRQIIEKWQLYIGPLVNHCIPADKYTDELYYEALENQLIMELSAYDYMILQINLAIQSGITVVKQNNSQDCSECDPDKKVTLDDIYHRTSSESSSSSGIASYGNVKKIQTGPTEVEYFNSSESESDTIDNAIKALKPGGMLDLLKSNICMLAQRLDIYLPICQRPSAERILPRVVNRREPEFLHGPDPFEIVK